MESKYFKTPSTSSCHYQRGLCTQSMLLREIIQYGDALGLTILMIAFVIARVLGLFGHWQISIKVKYKG